MDWYKQEKLTIIFALFTQCRHVFPPPTQLRRFLDALHCFPPYPSLSKLEHTSLGAGAQSRCPKSLRHHPVSLLLACVCITLAIIPFSNDRSNSRSFQLYIVSSSLSPFVANVTAVDHSSTLHPPTQRPTDESSIRPRSLILILPLPAIIVSLILSAAKLRRPTPTQLRGSAGARNKALKKSSRWQGNELSQQGQMLRPTITLPISPAPPKLPHTYPLRTTRTTLPPRYTDLHANARSRTPLRPLPRLSATARHAKKQCTTCTQMKPSRTQTAVSRVICFRLYSSLSLYRLHPHHS